MPTEIISLTCPNCGSADNTINNNIHFGYEFTCKNCGSTSVLVINNRLYIPSPGEKICLSCGRVAERNARFCQCGKSLIRKCISPECLKEFPIDHSICDYCGWPQNVSPSSSQGKNLLLDQYIQKIGDPDPQTATYGYTNARIMLESEEDTIIKHALDLFVTGQSLGHDLITDTLRNLSTKKVKEVIIPYFNQFKDTHRLMILSDIFCCLNYEGRNALIELLINEGPQIIPPMIKEIENLPSKIEYKIYLEEIREQVYQIFIQIGQPALPFLNNAIAKQKLSPQVHYDIEETIKKIKRKKLFWS